MRSRIKTLFFCLSAFRRERHGVLGFALLAALPLAAQPQQVHPNPDCQFFFTLTAANQFQPTGSGFDNRQQGCTTWSMSYVNSGFSGLTVTLQSAANNNGVAGTFGAGFPIQEATISGSNAATNTTGGFWWVQGTNAWVNVQLSGTTGSGTVQGAVFGWRIPNAGGGSGAGSIVCLTGDVAAGSGGSCTTATVQGIESVPFCSGYTPTNGQFVEYTTGGSPSPCYSAAAGGGGTIATTTNALKGDGGGNAVAVTGTATNCVLVNGTSAACGSGSSSSGLTVYSGLAGISLSGATVFFPIGGGSLASATEASVNTFQGSAGTVSGFGADISAALGTTVAANNVVVLTWRKNGANQAVTCTITNPAVTCSDTTHSFSFAAGDAIDIQAIFTGTIAATPIWVMNAGISSGTQSGSASIVGTAVFGALGSITGLVKTGIVTGVTYTSAGQYAVTISGSPSNYLVDASCGENASTDFALVNVLNGTYAASGFTVGALAANGGFAFADFPVCFVSVIH